MGAFTIRTHMAIFIWISAVTIIGINLYIVGGFLVDAGSSAEEGGGWVYVGTAISASFYLGFVLYLMRRDLQYFKQRAGNMLLKLGGSEVSELADMQHGAYSPLRGDGQGSNEASNHKPHWEDGSEMSETHRTAPA